MRLGTQQTLADAQQKVTEQIALVYLVQDEHIVLLQIGRHGQLAQQQSLGDEENVRALRLVALEADLETHLAAIVVEQLVRYTLREGDAGQTTWLGAGCQKETLQGGNSR